ncbi:MAG TPA: glucoamylase family protein [Bryobacteraceae bacterium]|nr:glucoamylase family protein [Bryobacteraceae bacterium]
MSRQTIDYSAVHEPLDHGHAGWFEAGVEVARGLTPLSRRRRLKRHPMKGGGLHQFIAQVTASPETEKSAWIVENTRLIFTARKEARTFALGLDKLPLATDSAGGVTSRVRYLAQQYLARIRNLFDATEVAAYLDGFQSVQYLEMSEIWGFKPALQMEIVERLPSAESSDWPMLVSSLRKINETNWKELFEAASVVHRVLAHDPAGVYLPMDFDSRDRYRRVVAALAKHSNHSEVEVAQAAIELCRRATLVSDGSRAAVRRTHAGYYLVEHGRQQLEAQIDYEAPMRCWMPRFLLRHNTAFYLAGIEILTLAIVLSALFLADSYRWAIPIVILLLLPATQAACDFVNNLVSSLIEPRVLPKLDLSEGIPDDCVTMVAVPTLLLSESQLQDLVLDLEIRFLANRTPNLYFALLTDSPDSDQPRDERDQLVEQCSDLIEGLNRRYGKAGYTPFYLLHRHRAYNESEGRWMGWERKRGKLLDLNKLLRGEFDAFPVKVGDESVFPSVRYVIALDSDTQLPRDSAAKLIGAIAHPLNQAVIDKGTSTVVEGYGILQPRIGIGIQSAGRSRLASLYSGQTGFDIYSRAVSDVYQDLFGEAVFTGKGIYEVDAMRASLEHRFPENALLSHDLIEGAYARVALVSDIELIDDYPSHFSAYSRRKHRWVRGDWQIMRWLRPRVPSFRGGLIPNPITLISRWKILDNLRRSLLEPGLLFLLLASWLCLPGKAVWWTLLTIGLLFIPVCSSLIFAVMGIPRNRRAFGAWVRKTARGFFEGIAITLCTLIFLLQQALVSIDAIARSMARVFVTGRKLLEWETAAEAESEGRPRSAVDIYMEWTPWIAIAIAAAIALVRPSGLPAAAPVLALWVGSRAFSKWLNRPPRTVDRQISTEGSQLLRESADRLWRFFHDWSSPASNWLIPDSVRENGAVELRISPTNLGMLLNARVAAVHLGLAPLEEFVYSTQETLDRVVQMPKFRGHLHNWHDVASLEPLPPAFISTVDSGNLVACLWTLKQAALAFASGPAAKLGLKESVRAGLQRIAETCDSLASQMDFGFLYDSTKKVLSIGYNITKGRLEPHSYDLLASEARAASFVAIAKGDIPQESWFHLGRAHTLYGGERVLLSWTGTMFEYLMPSLWMRTHPDTIMDQSLRAVVRVQREYARRKGVPWGISEAACKGKGTEDYGYAPFGVPSLATDVGHSNRLVISPYSSFLAVGIDPTRAVENLAQMREFGWMGRYGFYESIDYSQSGGEVMRMWMAHHQGMSLLAIANLLCEGCLQKHFHAEPQVLATELLLNERLPATALAEIEAIPEVAPAEA